MPIGCQAYTQRRQHTRQQEIIRDTEQNSACASADLHAGMSMGRNEYGIVRQKLGLPTVKLRLAAAAMDENILPVGIAGKDKGAAAFIQRTFYRFDPYIEPIGNRRAPLPVHATPSRSEEHTSELQSLMRISYAVFCLKKKNYNKHIE